MSRQTEGERCVLLVGRRVLRVDELVLSVNKRVLRMGEEYYDSPEKQCHNAMNINHFEY